MSSVSEVMANACNPGFCYGSGLQRDGEGTVFGFVVRVITRIIGWLVLMGGRSATAAAVNFGQEVHGQYVEHCKIRP